MKRILRTPWPWLAALYMVAGFSLYRVQEPVSGWEFSATPIAKGQAIIYESASEVITTCAATGTLIAGLKAQRSYVAKVKTENVQFRHALTTSDANWCNGTASKTDFFIGQPELIKMRTLGNTVTATDGAWNACCSSTGGTGVLVLTLASVGAP